MIKRRRMNENGGDLADVNEQELAKDSTEKRSTKTPLTGIKITGEITPTGQHK